MASNVSNQGSDYTYGNVDLVAGGVPTGTTRPTFNVIIPPQGGHGADIYRELGAYNVLLYSRIENDKKIQILLLETKLLELEL